MSEITSTPLLSQKQSIYTALNKVF